MHKQMFVMFLQKSMPLHSCDGVSFIYDRSAMPEGISDAVLPVVFWLPKIRDHACLCLSGEKSSAHGGHDT